MHMRSLHKRQADWINWLGERPLAFWILALSPLAYYVFYIFVRN